MNVPERGGGNPERENHGSDRSKPQMRGEHGSPERRQQIFSKRVSSEIRVEDEGEHIHSESRKRCVEGTVRAVLQEPNFLSSFPGLIIPRFEPPGAEERLTVSSDSFLSKEQNETAITEERDARANFGPAMLARARELGLAQDLTITDAQAQISLDKATTLESDVQSRWGMYHLNGWDSARSLESNETLILTPKTKPDGTIVISTVNLDELHQQDAAFVEEMIADYQVKEQKARIAGRVEYNNLFHASEHSDFVPPFLEEVSKIDDPEDFAIDAQSMLTFAVYLRTLGPSYVHRIYEFVRKMQDAHFTLPNGRSAHLESYFSHLVACPGSSEEDQQKNERMRTLYDGLSETVSMQVFSENVDYDSIEKVILDTPATYAYYAEKEMQPLREKKGKQVSIGSFFAQAKTAPDRASLHVMLEENLPEVAQTVAQLREKLGEDFLGKDTLNEVMCEVGKGVYYGSITSLDQLQERLGKALAQQLFGRGEGLGITFAAPGDLTSGHIRNKDLAMVLPALVLHETKEKIVLEKSVSVDFGSHQDGIKKAEQVYATLQGDLAAKSEKEVAGIDRALLDNAGRKKEFHDFVEENGILPDEIRLINTLVEQPNPLRDNYSLIDGEFYTAMFHALLLSKQGKIDFRSPVFTSFLQALYPHHAEAIAEHLK